VSGSAVRPSGAELSSEVARLYLLEKTHHEIRRVLDLTKAQLLAILTDLFTEGMPKRQGHVMTEAQVREVYRMHIGGLGSIDDLAEAIGFTGGTARRRIKKMRLVAERANTSRRPPARTLAHAEQREITAVVVARVERLRSARGWSVERTARESDLSLFTLLNLRKRLTDPRLSTLLGLCKGLGVTSTELLGDLPLPMVARPRSARVARRSTAGARA
jgi:DNA-binding Xre family transcriptional regulator